MSYKFYRKLYTYVLLLHQVSWGHTFKHWAIGKLNYYNHLSIFINRMFAYTFVKKKPYAKQFYELITNIFVIKRSALLSLYRPPILPAPPFPLNAEINKNAML